MAWTKDRVELLKKLWGDGQTASQIAKALGGVTRNAVIGKVHRLGLSNRSGGAETERKPKVQAKEQTAAERTKVKDVKPTAPHQSPAAPPLPKQSPMRAQIMSADMQLPPKKSVNEISPEALATHLEVQKKALRLSLMELTERTCKWPFGDPATDDFWFCGLPVEPGKVYCKPCAEVAHQPASARRDRRR